MPPPIAPVDPAILRAIALRCVRAGMRAVRDWDREATAASRQAELRVLERHAASVDRLAEAAICSVLREEDPGTPVVGEVPADELGARAWVIDPLDGTANVLCGDPFAAVTAALLVDGEPLVGATGWPSTRDEWSAVRQAGAFDRTGRRLAMSRESPRATRVVLDPPVSAPTYQALWSRVHERLTAASEHVERRASIALELALVARGEYDGAVHVGGSPACDFAAGTLLIREAGGAISALDGRTDPWSVTIAVAGTEAVHRQLCDALRGVEQG